MKISIYSIMDAFAEAESYLEMLMLVELKGGNKAKMNRYLQKVFENTIDDRRGGNTIYKQEYKKTILFIKQGIVAGEIPMKFLWNALDCPKDIEEVKNMKF